MKDFTDALEPAHPRGPDTLAQERSQSNLPVDALSAHLFSHDGFLERQDRILKDLVVEDLLSKDAQQDISRPDRYKLGLARAKLLRRMAKKLDWSNEDHKMAEYLVDDVSPYFLHNSMFITTIREQASPQQLEHWMPLVESWKIIGAYAQTELGHGSNVKGIELEAKWDPAMKNFILHSPTLTSSKWWNGSLGRTANHSIVVANLLLPKSDAINDYHNYGPHQFIVQIRDMESHQPLQGIVVGDIGSKYGYPSMDNAYCLFDHYRIPHSALLSRYSNVDPETGAYSKPENAAVVYGSLTYVRAQIVVHARLVLARAVTVAVRYLSIRRQFQDRDGEPGGPEVAVLDYSTVQIRILPLLATTFALHYAGAAMRQLYESTRKDISKGNFSALADLHSLSSGLKSLCTTLAADGIETSRRACGGHGFGGGSGLIQLNNDYLSKPTVEGDNWMITQQTASYIIKKVQAVVEKPNGTFRDKTGLLLQAFYQGQKSPTAPIFFDILRDDRAILNSFRRRAAALAFKAYRERVIKKRSWNSLLIQLHKLSKALTQLFLVEEFYSALNSASTLPNDAKPVILDCFRLFALYTIDVESQEFFTSGGLTDKQLDQIPERIQELMTAIRPHAVNLVDSWKIPDYLLDSALGRKDGRVYEDLFNRAHRLNPLNKITFNPRYWEEEVVMDSGDGGKSLTKL